MIAYLVAIAATALAVLLRWLLDPVMGDTLPLVTLFGAVAIAVWFGGYRPALLTVALGYLACAYLFIQPRGTFGFNEVRNLIGLFAYLVTALIIIAFGRRIREEPWGKEIMMVALTGWARPALPPSRLDDHRMDLSAAASG